jgi:hypothetical protein
MFIAALFTIAFGNSPDAPQLMNGLRKNCGIYTQWSIIMQP